MLEKNAGQIIQAIQDKTTDHLLYGRAGSINDSTPRDHICPTSGAVGTLHPDGSFRVEAPHGLPNMGIIHFPGIRGYPHSVIREFSGEKGDTRLPAALHQVAAPWWIAGTPRTTTSMINSVVGATRAIAERGWLSNGLPLVCYGRSMGSRPAISAGLRLAREVQAGVPVVLILDGAFGRLSRAGAHWPLGLGARFLHPAHDVCTESLVSRVPIWPSNLYVLQLILRHDWMVPVAEQHRFGSLLEERAAGRYAALEVDCGHNSYPALRSLRFDLLKNFHVVGGVPQLQGVSFR